MQMLGTETCQKYPGSVDHQQLDAETFAAWNVDYVKVDGCNLNQPYSKVYPSFGGHLNRIGHPMVYSCSWPAYDKLVGDGRLTYDPSKVQMALWAILAAPLLLSADLRNIKPEFKVVLQNRAIIVVNQDVLGNQGQMIMKHNYIEFWIRPTMPVLGNEFSYAVAVVNYRNDISYVHIDPQKLNLLLSEGYVVEDLYKVVSFEAVLTSFLL